VSPLPPKYALDFSDILSHFVWLLHCKASGSIKCGNVCVCVPTGTKRTCSVWKRACDGIRRRGQKLALRAKVWSAQSTPTPDLEYSPTRFSKKFGLP
jgi:hypothetical protein